MCNSPFFHIFCDVKELATNPVFIREGISVLDVVPGKLGDRWLVSTLGCLFLTKGFFYRVVPADQGFDTVLDGTNPSTGEKQLHQIKITQKKKNESRTHNDCVVCTF